ncbi:MAG: RNA polymerase-associated protein RapA [Chlamydiae bacterium]|nr:RNA polymerase-associated protein RapA [Chlamydiota bacterium]
MLNFRKLRQDFSTQILKEGKQLFNEEAVLGAKILELDIDSVRLSARVKGAFENVYECEIEIDRIESIAVDSNCDCTYTYDCGHIAALLYFLEKNLNKILVDYSEGSDLETNEEIDEEVKQELQETLQVAASKEDARKGAQYQKEVLREYVGAAKQLGASPFFLAPGILEEDRAELLILFSPHIQERHNPKKTPEFQLALRLPSRSKPLYIPNIKVFLDALKYREPIQISGKRFFFTYQSFSLIEKELLKMIVQKAQCTEKQEERLGRIAKLEYEEVGTLLAKAYDLAVTEGIFSPGEKEVPIPALYCQNFEEPLYFSTSAAQIHFVLEYLEAPGPTFLLKPSIQVDEERVPLEVAALFESTKPGIVYGNTYHRFSPKIKRIHLRSLERLLEITIPESLFGTFIENALPILRQYAEVENTSLLESFVTLPCVEEVRGRCVLHYLDGELDATMYFVYDQVEIPAAHGQMDFEKVSLFVGEEGILARNLVEERKLLEEIFEDFLFDEKEGVYRTKSEKKIVEFMTEVIPQFQDRIEFECPENLSDQFIYDESKFELSLKEGPEINSYQVELKVDGYLKGIKLDLLWDCIAAKRRFLELQSKAPGKGKKKGKIPRILVLDLEKISPIIQIFDEIGLTSVDNCVEERPLWSLTNLNAKQFSKLPVKFSMSQKLRQIQKQILGETDFKAQEVPKEIQATLRNYQIEGVEWLERLRKMHLSGILADDMGLGKTLQAIIAITQNLNENPDRHSLIVCPTSLTYNWKEEFHKFHPGIQVLVVDGTPIQRKKLLKNFNDYQVVVTSYNLLQKDIEIYEKKKFDYAILDEAQHIKNRGTRNAKSVKRLSAAHRLILTGTPIENSLEELWSLFDFLMPGLLSTFDRFVEKYIRNSGHAGDKAGNLDSLKKKVAPFILRRMKEDVLDDLPPVSEILYHCHLTDTQKVLYQSYAASAKAELSRLVKKEGFEKIQIHVLATLTRLKQICCHPAIFAKDTIEVGDSAKYDMLMDLLPTLIEGKHKTVIFSQYTKMLSILREDLDAQGVPFAYLDGSSKNRLDIVNRFNEDPNIPIFLVSLKAGGTGLNLIGADTVIHYDMWWNPAVENQATDRVHRIGQKKSVSSYKLVTLNTIEEKILNLQNRKKGLVKKIISSDEEAISKLTWEEVLELLQP